jgi:hypothetical protein
LKSCAAILAVNPDDAEALSIQQAITGRSSEDERPLRAKRGKTRPMSQQQEEKAGSAWPSATPCESVFPEMPEPTESLPASDQVAQNDAVAARLEAWLKTIQSRRQITPQ